MDMPAPPLPTQALTDAERFSALHELIGAPDPEMGAFTEAIRALVRTSYEAHVMPLVRAHWPELQTIPAGNKLEFLTCKLYATAPYTVLICSSRWPRATAMIASPVRLLGLDRRAIAKLAAVLVRALFHLLPQATRRRIVITGMFIATVDHVFDHCMDDVAPAERERRVHGVLDGTYEPSDPPLRLVRALKVAMGEGVMPADAEAFGGVIERVREWAASEVKAMTGVPDPSGLAWRMAGVLGTIDGLIFPVHRQAAPGAREWMYDVSLFVQMLDDWIDEEKDRKEARATPVLSGTWTLATVREQFVATLNGLEGLAERSGFGSAAFVDFAREAYRLMAHEVMQAMVKGTAA